MYRLKTKKNKHDNSIIVERYRKLILETVFFFIKLMFFNFRKTTNNVYIYTYSFVYYTF